MTFVFLKACFVPGSHFAYATGFAQKRKLYKIDYGATCVVFGIYHFENFLFPRFSIAQNRSSISLPSASPPAIERWPQGSLMCTLGGSPREKQKRKEG